VPRRTREKLGEVIAGRIIREPGVYEAATAAEAELLMKRLNGVVMSNLRDLLDRFHKDIAQMADRTAEALVAEQAELAEPIIKRAVHRLSMAFDVTLSVPRYEPATGEFEVEAPTARAGTKQVTVTKVESVTTRWTWRAWKSLWFKPVTFDRVTTVVRDEQVYLVDRRRIRQQLSRSFDAKLDEITGAIGRYVATDLSEQLVAYYRALDRFLTSYQESLQQALADAEKDGEQQRAVRLALESVVRTAAEHRAVIEGFGRQIAAAVH
jgi:hypothetical protein